MHLPQLLALEGDGGLSVILSLLLAPPAWRTLFDKGLHRPHVVRVRDIRPCFVIGIGLTRIGRRRMRRPWSLSLPKRALSGGEREALPKPILEGRAIFFGSIRRWRTCPLRPLGRHVLELI